MLSEENGVISGHVVEEWSIEMKVVKCQFVEYRWFCWVRGKTRVWGGANSELRRCVTVLRRGSLPDVLHVRSAMGNQPSSRLRGPPRIRSDAPNALGLSKVELDERCKPSGYVVIV